MNLNDILYLADIGQFTCLYITQSLQIDEAYNILVIRWGNMCDYLQVQLTILSKQSWTW